MSADQIEASAEEVLAARFNHPTTMSASFFAAYDEIAALYVAELREMEAG